MQLENTQYLLIFSNGLDKEIIKSFGKCNFIDMECTTFPKTKKVKQPIYDKIEAYAPDRIITLGNIAAKFILGDRFTKLERCHGGLFMLDNGAICIPTFDTVNVTTSEYRNRDIERAKKLHYSEPTYTEIDYVPSFSGNVTIDIETDSLEANEITSIQLADDNDVYYISYPNKEYLRKLYYKLVHYCYTDRAIIGHNLISFDLPVLSKHSDCDYLDMPYIYDTLILAHNRGISTLNLKHLTSMYTDCNNPEAYDVYSKAYAIADVIATQALYNRLIARGIREIDKLMCTTAIQFQRAKDSGIAIDKDKLISKRRELLIEIEDITDELMEYADINWNAPKEVSETLKIYGVPLKEKTKTGMYSVSSQVLEGYREVYAIVDLLLRYREANKLVSTFYDKYIRLIDDTGNSFIHPSMLITGTDTGRSSCKDPNLQQLPASVKDIFVSRYDGGMIAQFDLAQSELRCAVLISGDEVMSEALKGSDYHKTVASNAFNVPYDEVSKEQRKIAKIISFGALLYGGSAKGIAKQTGADEKVLDKAITNVKNTFTTLSRWQNAQIDKATKYLKVLLPYGFIRDVKEVKEYGYGNGYGNVRRVAMNTPIQGLSAFICYELVRYIAHNLYHHKSKFILQIHDSIFIDVHPDEIEYVANLCQQAFINLNYTHLSTLVGWGMIPVEGELSFNLTMKEECTEGIMLSSKE